jgi:multiple sugar transport system permease protein
MSTRAATALARPGRSGAGKRPGARRDTFWAWAFMSPTLLGLLFFMVGPMIAALYISFTDWSLLGAPTWLGLDNFKALFRDPLFWESWWNTLVYTCVSVPVSMLVGLGVALLLHRKLPGMSVFRVLFFIPMTVGVVASGLLWSWMFTPQYGLLNYLLHFVGLGPYHWLTSSSTSMLSIIIVGVWRGMGFNIIVFLAGLQGVPTQLYDAATVDGAGPMRRFWHVTVPMLSPTLFFGALIGLIMSFGVFEQTYVMTQGGPGNSTLTIIYFIFQQGFNFLRMGYASAASVTFLVILTVLTALLLRLQSRLVHYEN